MKIETRLLLTAAALLVLSFNAGCGQSGPLFIPGNPSTMAIPPSDASEESDEQDDQESPEPE